MIMVWTALFVFARGLAELLWKVRDQPRWRLVDLWYDAYLVGNRLLGLPADATDAPWQEAAAVLAAAQTPTLAAAE